MSNGYGYISSEELITLLLKKAIHGEKLVVLTESQWKAIGDAYTSNLMASIHRDVLIFHPVKEVETKITKFWVDDSV